jgi:lipid-binding SYLF domain-containing protein
MSHADPARMRTNPILRSTRNRTAAFVVVAVASAAACSHESSPETTAAKVESERADAFQKLDESTDAVADLRSRIPDSVARDTKCIVVVPSLVKAGFIVGGQGGSGYATCRTSNGGWSAPAPIHITGGTLGAQIGGESTELVALVKTDKGMEALKSGNFKVGVDASATAGPVGTGRSTSTDISEGGDLVSYTRSKGLYAGANLDGTTISTDDDVMKAMYGSEHDMKAVLSGSVPAQQDPHSQRFLGVAQSGFGPGH